MGREVRRVPPNWQHPKNDNGEYISLSGFAPSMAIVDGKIYQPHEMGDIPI